MTVGFIEYEFIELPPFEKILVDWIDKVDRVDRDS